MAIVMAELMAAGLTLARLHCLHDLTHPTVDSAQVLLLESLSKMEEMQCLSQAYTNEMAFLDLQLLE
jgi:hypothetical protein